MKKTIPLLKITFITIVLFSGAFIFSASAQESENTTSGSEAETSLNSILHLELLQGTGNEVAEEPVTIEYSDTTSPALDTSEINISEETSADTPSEANNQTDQVEDNETYITEDATMTPVDGVEALNRTSSTEIVSESATGTASSTDFWLRFTDNSKTTEKKDNSILESLRFWFNQYFVFRNMENNPSALHINDMHTVTNKNSAWLGWATNNLAFAKVYYSTTTPVEVSTSMTITTDQGETSATLKSLSEKTTYYYRILAEDTYGNTAVTGELSFTTK